jgi:hypothetical protein|tara:strand:+ start:16356 stop:17024 length:669 start_codon:yes stop_codon:yes gene_type:complete
MMLNYLQENNNKVNNFYTSTGIHVYIKDPLTNGLDMEEIIDVVENRIPKKFLTEVEMIIVGDLEEFEDRRINAMYKDGCLYITNEQDDSKDLIDDIIHEISHSLEEPYGLEIYGDKKLSSEFINKRVKLRNILWEYGYKTQLKFFTDTEYNLEFDDFLLNKVGYDKLYIFMQGLFISPYAATSLREYFATGFTDFFMEPDHRLLKSVSPVLYNKIQKLYKND